MRSEALLSGATPQIRNVGTLAGNLCQRPWCWYYRNGFKCLKNGGTTCFSVAGENEFHAIFGGGPSYIVHPSDTAPALVALDAQFTIASSKGNRVVAAKDFFTPLTTCAAPTPTRISPAAATITRPAGHASTPDVACFSDCELEDLEPSATEAALDPSAA